MALQTASSREKSMPKQFYLTKSHYAPALVAGLLALSILALPVSAKIYKWKDDNGKTHYTDSPAKIPKKFRGKDKGTVTIKEGPRDPTDPVIINLPRVTGRVIEVPLVEVNGSFFAEVLLNGKVKASLLVDTGASMVVLSQKIGKQLGYKSYGNMPKIPFNTAGGSVMSPLLTLRTMKVGGAKMRDVEASINQHMGAMDGLLGMTFLGEYKVEMDKKASKLTLSPLYKRGEQLWEGKNADWWKDRLGGYSKKAWNNGRGAGHYKKSDPAQYRRYKKLADYYQDLYATYKARAVRAGVPKQHIPPPLLHE